MFKSSEKGRFWRLTALPMTATATVVRGCPWWLAVTFSSFSLLPWPFSLSLPCCRALPPLFSLFFSFFSLFFPWFSFSFLFSLFHFSFFLWWVYLAKSPNDLILAAPFTKWTSTWLNKRPKFYSSLSYPLWQLMANKTKRCFRAVKYRFRIYLKRCLILSIPVLINCSDKIS